MINKNTINVAIVLVGNDSLDTFFRNLESKIEE